MPSKKTSGDTKDSENDKKARLIEVYKNALLRALKDEVITLEEDAILTELRKTLNISLTIHNQLQTELIKKLKFAAKKKTIEELIIKIQALIQDAKAQYLKITKSEEFLKDAKIAFDNELYNESKIFLSSAKRIIEDAKRRRKVEAQLSKVQTIINDAKNIGANVTEPNKFVNETIKALDTNNFTQARKSVSLARKSIVGRKRYRKEELKIIKAKTLINRLKRKEIDISEMEELLKNSVIGLKKGDYTKVAKNVAAINRLASKVTQLKNAQNQMMKVEELVRETKKLGADIAIPEDLMRNAKSAFRERNFKRVLIYTMAAKKALKEVTKTKKISDLIADIHMKIKLAKDVGGSVSTANRLSRQTEAALRKKNYSKALQYGRRALKSAVDACVSALRRSAKSSINNIKFLISEIKGFNGDTAKSKSLLNEVEKLLKKKEYEQASQIGREAEDYTKNLLESVREEYLREKAEESIKSIEFVIQETKEMGADVSKAETQLKKLQKMFEQGAYAKIDECVKEAEDLTKRAVDDFKLKHRVEKITDSMEATDKLIQEVKDMGIDVEEAELLLREAESMFQTHDYKEINTYLTKAHKAIKVSKHDFLHDKASVAITATQTLISDAEEIGADVTGAAELLRDAENLFKTEDFEAVDEHLKRAESLAKESWFQQRTQLTSDAISTTRELIKETKELGADVSEAEDLLTQVESMFRDKDFEMVDEYIKKTEDILFESRVDYRTQAATDAISETRTLIEETREMGVDVADAEQVLRQAESLFDEQDFDAVDEYLKRSVTLVEDIKVQHREKLATDKISKVYDSLADAKNLNIDVSTVEELLKTVEEKLKNKEFEIVEEYLDKSTKILEDSKERYIVDNVTNELKKVKNYIYEARDLGIDTAPYSKLLAEAEDAFEAREFSDAGELAKKARTMIEESKHEYLQDSIREILNNVKSLITEAETLGIDTKASVKTFHQAEAFFKSRDFEKAKSYAIKAEGKLNENAKDYIHDTFPEITIDFKKEGLQAGIWNKYSFDITNDGDISAKDLNFDLLGDDVQVKGADRLQTLEAGETRTIEVGIKTEKTGEIPLDLRVYYYRPFDQSEYEVEQEEQVRVSTSGTYIINDAFLIYKDGILISHESREFREDMDEDIFSGMLTAVQDFIKDSFRRAGDVGLRRLDFGLNKILIERGKNIYIAAVLAGAEPRFLPLFIIELIKQIEEKYDTVLDDWSGKIDDLEGVDEYIKNLLEVTVTEDGKLGEGVKSSIVPLQELISEAKEMGTDVSEAEELLSKADSMSNEEDFETVWEYVKKAESLVEHVKIQHYKTLAEEAFTAAQAHIADAKQTGVDISKFEKSLEEAEKAMVMGDYDNALSISEELNITIDKAEKYHDVERVIEDTRAKAGDIESQGFDVTGVDKKLMRATEALELEEYEKAKKLIAKADQIIEKSMVRVDEKVAGEIESVNLLISDVKKSGVDTAEAEQLLVQAQKAVDNKDFENAEEYLEQSRNVASVSKQDFVKTMASKAITSLESLIEESREEEASLDKANEYIQLAEAAYAKNDFEQAEEYSRKVEEIMSKVKEDEDTKVLRETINSTELLLEEAKSSGMVDTTGVEEFLNRAKAAIEGKEYRSAEEIALEAESLAKTTREMVVATQKAKGEGDEFIAPPGSPEEALVVALTGKKEVKPTDIHLTSIREMLDKMREPYREQIAQKDISTLEAELQEAINTEMDVAAVEEYLGQAKTFMEAGDLTKSEEFIEKAKSAMDIVKEEHRMFMISETVASTTKFIEEAGELGADITNAKELLELAESRVNVGDLDAAEEYLTNALNTAEGIKTEYLKRKASDAIELSKVELEYAKSTGIKVTDAEKLFKQAKVVFEDEDYETAAKYANNAKDLLEEYKAEFYLESIQKSITSTQVKIDEVRKLGADVTELDAIINQASTLLNTKNYAEAETQAQNAETLLESVRQPYLDQLLSATINSVWGTIQDAKKYGAEGADLNNAEELFKTAQSAFSQKDYLNAENQITDAEQLAQKAKEEYYEKYLEKEVNSIRSKIQELKGLGIDVEDIDKSMLKVESAFNKKEFKNIGYLMKFTRGLISRIERVKYLEKASDAISFSKALLKYIKHNIKGLGTKITSAEDLLRLSEQAFNRNNYFEAERLATECNLSVEQLEHAKLQQFLFVFRQLRAEEMIDDAKNLFVNIKKIGIDISEAEELLKKGEDALRDDETYAKGREYLTQAKIMAKDVEREFHKKNAASAISAAQSLIIEIKKTGVDVTESKKLLAQGKAAFDDGEYKKSIIFAGKAKLAAKKLQK